VTHDTLFTAEEVRLIKDTEFFQAKARIMAKVRSQLESAHAQLRRTLADVELLVPSDFDRAKHQLVKGEHLAAFPYQYLDYPKHFAGDVKVTFRTLFWWGHHFVFALLLEAGAVASYKQNLINRYRDIADRGLELCLSPTLWEWRSGVGYTLPLTGDRKPEVSAVLSNRPSLKLARFLPLTHPAVAAGEVPVIAGETLRALLPVIRP
jgi:hypothetical protein